MVITCRASIEHPSYSLSEKFSTKLHVRHIRNWYQYLAPISGKCVMGILIYNVLSGSRGQKHKNLASRPKPGVKEYITVLTVELTDGVFM